MDIDDILTYICAIDFQSRGLLTQEDVETIVDTLDLDFEEAMETMVNLFLGTLDSANLSWDELRAQWAANQERIA